MSKTFFSLASGDFLQDWTNTGQITTADDWSNVASIVGYLGDTSASTTANAVPVTSTAAELGAVQVFANQTNPNTFTSGGVAEFQIANPTIALQGSGTADDPSLVLYMDATGRSTVHLDVDLRDIDGSADNAVQPVNVQFRVGDTGAWTNVTGGLVSDASTGPSLATQVTHLSLDLPTAADNQAQVEIRILTSNATGSDEWIGLDNIHVSSQGGVAADTTPPTLTGSAPADGATGVADDANITLTFSEPVYAGTGSITITDGAGDTRSIEVSDASQVSISGSTVTLNPTADLTGGDTYHVSIGSGVLRDAAGNAYAGTDSNPIDFTTVNPAAITHIYDIQGAAQTSPYAGAAVTTQGVVTAVDTTGARGFFIQDAVGDGDTATSDGVFVFTSSVPTVSVGQLVQVSGTVTEYNGGDTNNLTTTEITTPAVTVIGTGAVAATVIGHDGLHPPTEVIESDGFTTFDPAQDGADFYESLEGMLVTVKNAQAVGSTYQGATWVVADQGQDATGVNDRGGITIADGDFNPERIQVYADSGVLPGFNPAYAQGSQLGDVSGVISYFRGEYELLATSVGNTTAGTALPDEVTGLSGATDRLTLGEYNVANLDPTDPKFDALAHDIVANLGGPDVIGLEEIQDADGAGAGANLSGGVTLQKLIDAVGAAGGPHYRYVEIAPTTTNVNGGEPNGNIRNAFLYNPDRVDYVQGSARQINDPNLSDGDAFRNSRHPLVADFVFNGEKVTGIVVHNYARSGSQELFGANQPPINSGDQIRIDQDAAVHAYVQQLQSADPSAKIAVVGDFNAFQFETALTELEAGGSLVNLDTLLAPTDRYSEQFQGLSEQIDHQLVSPTLQAGAQFDIVHLNTGQPDSANAPSDHDPTLSALTLATVDHTATGTGGADQFYGGAGNDSFYGGDGADLLSGRAGADLLDGGAGADTVYGGDGGDTLYGHLGAAVLDGGAGDDVFYLDGYVAQVTGGDGADTARITGTAGYDASGHVGLFSGVEQVLVNAGLAALSFSQETSGLQIGVTDSGGAGGYAGAKLIGTEYADTVTGGAGADNLNGNKGDDILFGGSGNDTLRGGEGVDQVYGGDGDDFVIVDRSGGAPDTVLSGGAGVDRLDYTGSLASSGFGLDISRPTSAPLGTQVTGFELLSAVGSGFADTLHGGAMNDSLNGGAGDDFLFGDLGTNQLTGGDGFDTAVFVGHYADFSFRFAGGFTIATDAVTGEVDYLKSIESLSFDNGADGGHSLTGASGQPVAHHDFTMA